ncbi:MAG: hypothetical protein KDD60_02570, partial [Bdellovibrionales bacterium]|nr:hypothetical protein [Bdellovibrionales bacterium]
SRGETPTASINLIGSGEYRLDINAAGTALTRVSLRVSDGITSFYRYIFVIVNNHSPVIGPVAMKILPSGGSVEIPLSISDPDGDTLAHSIVVRSAESEALALHQEYGFSELEHCRLLSECRSGDQWLIYSDTRRSPVVLRATGESCVLSINSVEIGRLPVNFCHAPHKILHPEAAIGTTPSAVLSSSSLPNPTLTVSIGNAQWASVSVHTTDGVAEADTRFFVHGSGAIGVDDETNEVVSVLDSDGDGISDAQEVEDGTDIFDRGSNALPSGGDRYAWWSHYADTELSLHLLNRDVSNSATGVVTVFDTDGNSTFQANVNLSAGGEAVVLLRGSDSAAEAAQGYLQVATDGGNVAGYVELKGESLIAKTRGILSRLPLRSAASGISFAPFSPGRLLGEEFICDVQECLSELNVVNLGDANEVFEVALVSNSGEVVHTQSFTLTPGASQLALDPSDLETVPSFGSYRVTPQRSTARYLAVVEDSGWNALDEASYLFVLNAVSGNGTNREAKVSSLLAEESSSISLLNTLPMTIWVSINVIDAGDRSLHEQMYPITSYGRFDLDLTDIVPEGEEVWVQVGVNHKESLIVTREQSYDIADGEQLAAHLREVITTVTADATSLATWRELLAQAIDDSAPPSGGEGGEEEPISSLDGYTLQHSAVQIGKEFEVLALLLDPSSEQVSDIGDHTLKLLKLKRGKAVRLIHRGTLSDRIEGVRKGSYRFTLVVGDESLNSRKFTLQPAKTPKKGSCKKRGKRRKRCS